MKRYFIHLAYNGANYCGWQVQPQSPSVQAELERCLSLKLGQPVSVTGCALMERLRMAKTSPIG